MKDMQEQTGVKLLGEPQTCFQIRAMNGAGTILILLWQMQVLTKAQYRQQYLGGENYVFWGGREGYMTLRNTDMKENSTMNVADTGGLAGRMDSREPIEPKPMEPTKHQYD